ncbi:MAG: hypothetical protein WC043_03405 [Pseudobdellovibrionaceae bacterium]
MRKLNDDVLDSGAIDPQIKLLLEFMRAEKGNHPVTDFYAELSNEIAHLGRDIRQTGLVLAEKWKAGGLSVKLREYKDDLIQIGITSSVPDTVEIKRKGKEFLAREFFLPKKQMEAVDCVMAQLIEALPDAVREELFERVPEEMPDPSDEGAVKAWAVRRAEEEGLGNIIPMRRSDVPRQTSFSPARRALGRT